jgi:putative membrane protein
MNNSPIYKQTANPPVTMYARRIGVYIVLQHALFCHFKNYTTMSTYHLKNHLFYSLLILAATLFTISCKDNRGDYRDDRNDTTGRDNADNDANRIREKNEKFLTRTIEFDHEQVLLAQLAKQRATNAEVKAFAGTLENEHTSAKTRVENMLSSKSIALPSEPYKDANDAYDKLNEKSQDDFDKAYINRVVERHNDAINWFEECIKDGDDAQVTAMASERLPDLRRHLARAKELDARFAPFSDKMNK